MAFSLESRSGESSWAIANLESRAWALLVCKRVGIPLPSFIEAFQPFVLPRETCSENLFGETCSENLRRFFFAKKMHGKTACFVQKVEANLADNRINGLLAVFVQGVPQFL